MKKQIKKAVSYGLRKVCLYCVPPQRDKMLPYAQAEQILSRHCPDAHGGCLEEHRQLTAEYDLSVIVPVYNVAPYLKQCMDSIFAQKTDYRFEVIAVNDGSTDASGAILETYRSQEHFRLIHQSNRGIAGARNRGLQEVRGRYLMFVDSDDFLPANAVQSLMYAAACRNADIVQGSFCHVDESGQRSLGYETFENRGGVAPNGVVTGMAWGKVYKASLWEHVCFPEGYWFEDTVITSLLTHLARRIATVSDPVYYYRRNSSGITKSSAGKPKSIDSLYVLRSVLEARHQLNMTTDSAFYEHLIRLMILSVQRTSREPEPVRKSIFSLKSHNKVLWAAMLGSLLLTTLVIEVPFIANAFCFTSIGFMEYGIALALAVVVIPIVELVKLIQRKVKKA